MLIKLYRFTQQLGFDLRKTIKSPHGLIRYIFGLLKFIFKGGYKGRIVIAPYIHDWWEEAGAMKTEYFIQDLYVAKRIKKSGPNKHVDIGSRIDGFVANVASFMEIQILDIRKLTDTFEGISFYQIDLMNNFELEKYININGSSKSLSCLHTIEHFGLGRYGDKIDVNGFKKGIKSLSTLLEIGGVLYLSTPIGVERVEYNANRVFAPNTIINLGEANNLKLKRLSIIDHNNIKIINVDFLNDLALEDLSNQHYNLGIFEFVKESTN